MRGVVKISEIILEGGNLLKAANVGKIHKSEVIPTVQTLARIFPELDISTENLVGSSNKKQISGDLDFAFSQVDGDMYGKIVNHAISLFGKHNVVPRRSNNAIHFACPITKYDPSIKSSKRTGKVQVDFNFGDQNWIKCYYHSPSDDSKYKGMHRNILLSALASFIDKKESNLVDKLKKPTWVEIYVYSQSGLTKFKISSMYDVLGSETEPSVEKISTPITNFDEILTILGKGKLQRADCYSLETLTSAISKIYPEKMDEICSVAGPLMVAADKNKEYYPLPACFQKYATKSLDNIVSGVTLFDLFNK